MGIIYKFRKSKDDGRVQFTSEREYIVKIFWCYPDNTDKISSSLQKVYANSKEEAIAEAIEIFLDNMRRFYNLPVQIINAELAGGIFSKTNYQY